MASVLWLKCRSIRLSNMRSLHKPQERVSTYSAYSIFSTARRSRRIKITEDSAAWREKNFYKKYEDRWNYD